MKFSTALVTLASLGSVAHAFTTAKSGAPSPTTALHMGKIANNVLELIGGTPLVKLTTLEKAARPKLFAN